MDVSGWESPGWFADLSVGQPAALDPLGWGRHHWFPNWAAEHRACREGVSLIDMSFMSKFTVEGPGAGALLDYLSTVRTEYRAVLYKKCMRVCMRVWSLSTDAAVDDF